MSKSEMELKGMSGASRVINDCLSILCVGQGSKPLRMAANSLLEKDCGRTEHFRSVHLADGRQG